MTLNEMNWTRITVHKFKNLTSRCRYIIWFSTICRFFIVSKMSSSGRNVAVIRAIVLVLNSVIRGKKKKKFEFENRRDSAQTKLTFSYTAITRGQFHTSQWTLDESNMLILPPRLLSFSTKLLKQSADLQYADDPNKMFRCRLILFCFLKTQTGSTASLENQPSLGRASN